jgi:hypothetical protein
MDGLWLRPEVDFRWQEEVIARFENYIGASPIVLSLQLFVAITPPLSVDI